MHSKLNTEEAKKYSSELEEISNIKQVREIEMFYVF